MERALVCDVRYRMSLPVIRALGRAGITVDTADLESTPEKKSLGFASRYAERKLHLPSPDDVHYISALKEACGSLRPVILPVGISSLLTIAEAGDEVREFADIAIASPDSIALANDKSALMVHAKSIGIPTPETTTLLDNETVAQLSERISYPVVIKYRAGELLGLDPKDRYTIVSDSATFISRFSDMHSKQSHPLVQQYIAGDGYGVSAVFDKNHNPLTVFCHRRIREYPISGGPSSMCISVWEQTLVDHATKLLKSLNWVGVAMVEFKGNPKDGFYLMEINPRFWGSLALAPLSGCNIPLALYRAARGELAQGAPKPDYKIGKKMQFILQDTLSIPGYLKQSKSKLALVGGFLLDVLNPAVSDGVWSFRDIKSSLRYFSQALKKTDKIVR